MNYSIREVFMRLVKLGLVLSLVVSPIVAAETVSADAERVEAPDFTLVTLKGDTISLSDYKGKVVIIDFWATWCGPCVREIPHYIELQKEYGDSGLVVIGIALDAPERVEKFAEARKLNYPVAIGDKELANRYGGIKFIPTTFVIDQEGRIYKKYVGYQPKEVFLKDFIDLRKEHGEEKAGGQNEK